MTHSCPITLPHRSAHESCCVFLPGFLEADFWLATRADAYLSRSMLLWRHNNPGFHVIGLSCPFH